MKRAICILALLTLIGRVLITPRLSSVPSWEGSYEAFAHGLSIGLILIGAYDWYSQLGPARKYFWLGWALGIYELIYFLIQKAHSLGKI